MSIGGFNDDDELFVTSEVTAENQLVGMQIQLKSAHAEIDRLTAISALNLDALKLLIKICQENGFNPFPDIPIPKLMTSEQLIERNRQIKIKRVTSKEAIGYPSEEDLLEIYKLSPESKACVDMILNLSKEKITNE